MNLEQIAAFAKSKGYIIPNSNIYGNFKGTFDFGPNGCEIRNNILKSYRNYFIIPYQNIVEQHGAIISDQKVWKAAGHLEKFNDPVAINTKGLRYRADHLIQENVDQDTEGKTCEDLLKIIEDNEILYEGDKIVSVEPANLMFKTTTLNGTDCYLRPETCQSIFINTKLISTINRLQLPFGIAQHGKVFRNEIAPKNFIFRCREFEQLELEFFFNPESKSGPNEVFNNIRINCLFSDGTEESIFPTDLVRRCGIETWHAYWITKMINWLNMKIGLKINNLRLREHNKKELAHYSSSTFDIEYKYPIGQSLEFKELAGVTNRGNYDITQHACASNQNLKMKCPDTKEKIYPHVIEPSIGLERLFLAILCDAYEYDEQRGYIVLHLSSDICPVEYGVFPLPSKNYFKDKFYEKARDVQKKLIEKQKTTYYDQVGSIGRRYARQDEIGTKWCITIDESTLDDDTVTVRDRDTKDQYRIKIEDLINRIE